MNGLFKALLKIADTDQTSALSIFLVGGEEISRSKIQSWTVSESNKKYRPIAKQALIAFVRGLKSEETEKYRSTIFSEDQKEILERVIQALIHGDTTLAYSLVESIGGKSND